MLRRLFDRLGVLDFDTDIPNREAIVARFKALGIK